MGAVRPPNIEFRSIAALDRALATNLGRFAPEIDLVVGIPRSGLLVANLFALRRGVRMTDLDGLNEGRLLRSGARLGDPQADVITSARRILVLDDSVDTGRSLREAKDILRDHPARERMLFGAVFVSPSARDKVDVYCEVIEPPRVFSWNLMSHGLIERAAFDIDGVLCVDPTSAQNDDGPRYRDFLTTAQPLALPTRQVGELVTSRLEKYRPETEAWLAAHGVEYGTLHMLDLPDAETRRRLNAHASFKAEIYGASESVLFVESEDHQARAIATATNKPVICTGSDEFYNEPTSAVQIRRQAGRMQRRVVRAAKARLRRLT
ncbi:MAG: phosphoribosyltransferase family protein [Actinomycetota bacterium]